MEESIEWIREDSSHHLLNKEDRCITIDNEPGHMWGESNNNRNACIFNAKGSKGILKEVGSSVSTSVKISGEQAGILLFINENNYLKCVIEFLKDEIWLVLAIEIQQKARVIKKISLNELYKYDKEDYVNIFLRFRLLDDGKVIIAEFQLNPLKDVFTIIEEIHLNK